MNKFLAVVVGVVLCVPFLGWAGARIYNGIIFDREVGGHLKRAADANSIEIAKKELEVSLKAMEQWKMTEGYTSIIYTTPDEDVGFWYTNIKTCVQQINELPPTATQGEKDLVLLKLRETLLDHGKQGHESITAPDGISAFPYNLAFVVWLWLTAPIALLGAFIAVFPFVPPAR